MANFHVKTFVNHDDYMTPYSAWQNIAHLLPNNKVIWEPFFGNGQSIEHLKTLGFTVVGSDEDFFENNRGDIVVTNPPFSIIQDILKRLIELDKPFVMILPTSKINTQYFRKLFLEREFQLIIPKKRIQFDKLVNGIKEEKEDKCNFDCLYYCYKMNFHKDILFC